MMVIFGKYLILNGFLWESLNEAMLDSNSVRNDLKNKVIINEKGEQMGKVLCKILLEFLF